MMSRLAPTGSHSSDHSQASENCVGEHVVGFEPAQVVAEAELIGHQHGLIRLDPLAHEGTKVPTA